MKNDEKIIGDAVVAALSRPELSPLCELLTETMRVALRVRAMHPAALPQEIIGAVGDAHRAGATAVARWRDLQARDPAEAVAAIEAIVRPARQAVSRAAEALDALEGRP